MYNRVIVLVMDSVGIGSLPDAAEYGDFNVNTLANIARLTGGLFLPSLEKLGLGCIHSIDGVKCVENPLASYGKMAEISKAKDTTSGHWELAGCPVFSPFPVYPKGFPPEVIEKFENYTGRKVLGNKVASGTAIIEELGEAHIKTGCPIVYTSADSVFQIAAHEEIIPLPELYELCRISREKVCVGQHAVGRVIARPFIGTPGNFKRTSNRHDYSLEPTIDTMLDLMKNAGHTVNGIGKIGDIYAHRGLSHSYSSKSNDHGMEILAGLLKNHGRKELIMINLVDFDSVYGHRNDIKGYKEALERFDKQLDALIALLKDDDLFILTADHGCDPTTKGTDHTREYVPILVYRHKGKAGNIGIRSTFADVAATVAENFKLPPFRYGKSFLNII